MPQKNYLNYIKYEIMKANRFIERVYELLEKNDFTDLAEEDKIYVRSVISENEYNKLRRTLRDTEAFFGNTKEFKMAESGFNSLLSTEKKKNTLIKLLKRPIQLYKVAAALVVLLGIYSFIHLKNVQEKNSPLISNDTIYIYKIDTVYSKIVDTVKLLKQKIVYLSHDKDTDTQLKLLSNAKYEYDPDRKSYCDDIEKIMELAFNNSFSNDTLLKN
jgi:hypothetical protein